MKYNKPKNYEGGDLIGDWDITFKIDGIRAFVTDQGVFSRNGKPLYNLDFLISKAPMDIEVFCGSWEKTVTKVKTRSTQHVLWSEIYSLDPLDTRLFWKTIINPTELKIQAMLQSAIAAGNEGLVLRNGKTWLKVKPFETYDVPISGIIEGTGKYKGMLGAFKTSKGKVGTGFNDEDRKVLYDSTLINSIVEVECQGLTPAGMFRHPRYKRMRFDK